MSASLVGSEMCIRDSLLLRGICLFALEGRWLLVAATPEVSRAGSLWAGPVSYTHLTLRTICSV
eukprot:3638055-Alexandrium_andersonii.AAC.1